MELNTPLNFNLIQCKTYLEIHSSNRVFTTSRLTTCGLPDLVWSTEHRALIIFKAAQMPIKYMGLTVMTQFTEAREMTLFTEILEMMSCMAEMVMTSFMNLLAMTFTMVMQVLIS